MGQNPFAMLMGEARQENNKCANLTESESFVEAKN